MALADRRRVHGVAVTETVAPKAHVELSPSSSHRWMHCPGSLAAERGLPDTDSIHSQEGTAAHALAEIAFQRDRHPTFWVGEVIEGITVTEDMAAHVQTYVEALRDYAEGAEIVRIERKLMLPPSMKPPAEMGGTCDSWFYYPASHLLRVADLKYGKGVVVEAEEQDGQPNPQLAYYAVLAWLDLFAESPAKANAVEEIELVVVQPRAFHAEGPIRTFRMTLQDLKVFARKLLQGAHAALAPDAPRQSGSHCRFCKAKLTCAAFRDQALSVAKVTFADVLEDAPLDLPAPATMGPDELGKALKGVKTLEAWLKVVEQTAMGELLAGRPVTGFALKPKRADRKWASEQAVLDFARKAKVKKGDLMTDPTLKSPAQVETLLKGLGLSLPETLTVRESSGYSLTTDTDPKAVVPTAIPALDDSPATSLESMSNG